jgi:endonuclease G, mitochondrial
MSGMDRPQAIANPLSFAAIKLSGIAHCLLLIAYYLAAFMKKHLLVLTCFLAILLTACKKEVPQNNPVPPDPEPTPLPNPPAPQFQDNDHILPGNPTNAKSEITSGSNYLKDNKYYKIAYHASRAIPLWVGWHLEAADLGSTPRQDDFRPDQLPSEWWYVVTHSSYTGSGFDRGHNCPSADRTSSVAANSSTFLMTNIIPQAPMMNQGPWADLEDHIRNNLVGNNNEAFVVMGNYGEGGRGSAGEASSINNGKVIVPNMIWKVALIIPKGNDDLKRIDTSAMVLVVNMPNDNSLYSTNSTGRKAWKNYLTTISALESQANGAGVPLNMLSNVDTATRTYLKKKLFY